MPTRSFVIAVSAMLILFNSPFAASAGPMMAGEAEGRWNEMLAASIHVQAEIVSTPVASFGPWFRELGNSRVTLATCAADAVARSVFDGKAVLPVGTRFRFSWTCYGSGLWYIHGHEGEVKPNAPGERIGGHVRGELVELLLSSTPPSSTTALAIAGQYAMKEIPAITGSPAINPERYPPWYNKQFAPKMPVAQNGPWWLEGHVQLPAPFPRTSVTVTYISSAQSGRLLTAAYDAPMQRVLVGWSEPTRGTMIEDPVVGVVTQISEGERTYTVKSYVDRVYDAAVSHIAFDKDGTDVVAGISCTNYVLARVSIATGQKPLSVCMADDGLRLRDASDTETTTVVSIRRGTLTPSATIVPDGFVRVPADNDVKTVRPPPMPID